MRRVERIALARQRAAIRRVAARVAAAFPDLVVEEGADAVVLAGPGLSRRMLHDARLRGIGADMRAALS